MTPIIAFLRNCGCKPDVVLAMVMLALITSHPLKLVASARDQLTWGTQYDARYVQLKYPMGDVPRDRGVCTDVIIRAYRGDGIDLQKLIYEDKKAHPLAYSSAKLDPNIDHRRVPNQAAFFKRHGAVLALDRDWKPGDVVWWKLKSGLDHTGLLSDSRGASGEYKVVHNLSTPVEEDCLRSWRIVGHFRW